MLEFEDHASGYVHADRIARRGGDFGSRVTGATARLPAGEGGLGHR